MHCVEMVLHFQKFVLNLVEQDVETVLHFLKLVLKENGVFVAKNRESQVSSIAK